MHVVFDGPNIKRLVHSCKHNTPVLMKYLDIGRFSTLHSCVVRLGMLEALLEKLRLIRLEKGLSQEYLANTLDVQQATYGRWENGKTPITLKDFLHICNALGVSFDQLMTWPNPPKAQKPKGKVQLIVTLTDTTDVDTSLLNKIQDTIKTHYTK